MNNSGQTYANKSNSAIPENGYTETEALTFKEVMAKLKVRSRNTIYGLIDQEKLSAYKIGRSVRFNRAEVESLITKSKNQTQDVARADS